jgi:hypothetical protein
MKMILKLRQPERSKLETHLRRASASTHSTFRKECELILNNQDKEVSVIDYGAQASYVKDDKGLKFTVYTKHLKALPEDPDDAQEKYDEDEEL